ncbi:hypothetical protein E4N62_16205 [Streptomyces sp. MNU76]|uniref:hypothetical protein n=1 Tax=Streptomyces sp. MNU76 TaxID=2560026 RepID=UPI001E29FFB1|nr:hypothetical protein [Streptomyces sp. MNU76]MCC9706679.1 hypothetical protein [Streptomyces sp. MNU76]
MGSVEEDLDAVDVHAVAGAHLDGAEAESLVDAERVEAVGVAVVDHLGTRSAT